MNAKLYKGKYRIASTRLRNWDYGSNAAYFITICTQNRVWAFGKIQNGIMYSNKLGNAVLECWHAIPAHFPFVIIDAFIVMPNHVHGIIIINKQPGLNTQNDSSLPHVPHINTFGPQSQNLASIVRGFKIGVTKYARQNGLSFAWQSRYHEHIIRNRRAYNNIRWYIANNPANWSKKYSYMQ